MKIAFLVSSFPTLSETFILNQITGLIDRGHDVDIFADHPQQISKIHPDVSKYDLLSRTNYRNMPTSKLKRIIHGIKLISLYIRKNPNIVFRCLNILKYGKLALSLQLLFALPLFLDKGEYDIIHCHFGPNGTLGVILREIGLLQGKIITSFHGYDVNVISEPDMYKHLFQEGDLFTTNTLFTKKRVIELGGPEEKINILPVGLPLEKFPFQERKFNGKDINILTVARLVEKKGLEYSIKAVSKLIKAHPNLNIHYRIVGYGPLKQSLLTLVTKLGVETQVKLLGAREQHEIRRLFQQSEIFVLSSVTAKNGDREGQALVLQEAQAMGLPVVSTLHNGIPEGVLNNESGFLVPERDVDALAERLDFLVRHSNSWPKMGRAGRDFVEKHYDINKLNCELVRIYEKLVV